MKRILITLIGFFSLFLFLTTNAKATCVGRGGSLDCPTGSFGCSTSGGGYYCCTDSVNECLGGPDGTIPPPGDPGDTTPIAAAPIHDGCGQDAINTAVGCIPTSNPQAFVSWFLAWGIGLSGGLAFLFIALGGIRIMTSGGNPQSLQEGKEMLTAAVSGLIMIIFSVLILKLIGVEILKIPGFV